MTLLAIFGLTSVIVMGVTVLELRYRLKLMMEKPILLMVVPKSNSSIPLKTPKLSSEEIALERRHQELLRALIFARVDTPTGTRDISGFALRLAVCSQMISQKGLKLSQKPLKSGFPKIPLSKSERTTKGQK